jgi:hypothetical protein
VCIAGENPGVSSDSLVVVTGFALLINTCILLLCTVSSPSLFCTVSLTMEYNIGELPRYAPSLLSTVSLTMEYNIGELPRYAPFLLSTVLSL